MDNRVQTHAEILVEHCTEIETGDTVLIKAPVEAEELVVALYEQIGRQGGQPMLTWRNPRATRAYLRSVDDDAIQVRAHELAAMEETDVTILIKAARNTAETSDVSPETGAAASEAGGPVLRERLDSRWVITQHPTAADAQQAGMSTAGWQEYVYDAVVRDWAAVRQRQSRVADVLEAGETVHLTAGERTDLTFSIAGMAAYNDDGTENMPGGEVATAPVVDSVDGRLAVDYPVRRHGRTVEGIELQFEDGVVVEHSATRNQETLTRCLETDDGASRLGEFGIGMNAGVDSVSHNVLFDEKMAGTVHLALGQAMEECVPDDRECNESTLHQDLLVDTTDESRIEVDGERLQQDGAFWFEEPL